MEEKEDLGQLKANIYSFNNTLKDFELPSTMDEFKDKIKHFFLLQQNINDNLYILYYEKIGQEKKERPSEVKNEDDYHTLLKMIKDGKVWDTTIFIDTNKIPSDICSKESENFEEEIKLVIETQLKAAGERIKKYLSGNTNMFANSKIQKRCCDNCYRSINGTIFKSVTDIDEKFYCEKCSEKKEPTFIIH